MEADQQQQHDHVVLNDGNPDAAPDHAPALASKLDGTLLWFRTDDAAAPSAAWSNDAQQSVALQRASLPQHSLFLDELLTLAGLDPALYPPTSHDALTHLLSAIYSSHFDDVKQACLVYYLVRDIDAMTDPASSHTHDDAATTPNRADAFAASHFILPHFKQLTDAYWLLDHGHYEDAVPLLDKPDFIPKIYRTLFCEQGARDKPTRTPLQRSRLLLRFLRTSMHASTSPQDSPERLEELAMQVEATSWVRGPTKAFGLVREIGQTFEDDAMRQAVRGHLMSTIFQHCFAPPNPTAIKNLLGCFLHPDEEVALETFVLTPPASMTATWSYIAADVLIVRFINEGRYMDAVRLDRRLGPDVREGHSSTADHAERSRLMEKRKRLIAGAREILPEVQKELLRIEESMEISAGRSSAQPEAKGGATPGAGDLKMSWEHVARNEATSSPQPPASPIGTASKLTPLSASPALRHHDHRSPNTQAALLSAVVRASASPKTATKASGVTAVSDSSIQSLGEAGKPTQPGVGFLASNSLAFGQGRPNIDAADASGDMDEDSDGGLTESAPPAAAAGGATNTLGKPGYRMALPAAANGTAGAAASPSPLATNAALPHSPWRNAAPLSSTSPFSGQPKIPSSSLTGRMGGPPSSSTASPFRPANTSPFVAASASSRHSPLTAAGHSVRSGSPSVVGSQRLTGALALISKQGRRRDPVPIATAEVDDEMDEDEDAQDADDTFVGRPVRRGAARSRGKGVQVGRLVHGRASLSALADGDGEAEHDEDEDENEEPEPTTNKPRPTRNSRGGTSLSQSRSEATALSRPITGGRRVESSRQTRSSTSANRKPLTLSNLAANDESHSTAAASTGGTMTTAAAVVLDSRPIARRTRAATAEAESVLGDGTETEGGGSTIYSISEVGDEGEEVEAEREDGVAELPTRAVTARGPARGRGKRSSLAVSATKKKMGGEGRVRRSSRLSSVEPESTQAQGQLENQENQPPLASSSSRRRRATATPATTTTGGAEETTSAAASGTGAGTGTAKGRGVRTRSAKRTMPGALNEDEE